MVTNDGALEKESLTSLIYSLAVIFVTLSTSSVFLRLYTRYYILDIVGADDIIIAIAQILAIAVSVTTVFEAVWGLGRHTQFVPPSDATKQLKCLYANVLIYNASQILTKISFLIQYRRLFPGPKSQRVCFWLLLFIVAWGLIQEFIVAFACTPLSAFEPKMTGKCIYTLPIWYLTSCMNIVTDFMIFITPISPLLKLQIPTGQKFLLLGLFCLGFFTCVISLVRLSTLNKGIHTEDPFWDNAPAAYWSVVELNCGILCACLQTLRPLAQKFVPHLLSTRYGSGGGPGRPGTAISQKLSTLNHKKSHTDALSDEGIYVQRDIELHSTTQLRSNAAVYAASVEDGTSTNAYIGRESSSEK